MSKFCAASKVSLSWTRSPTGTQVASGWCWAYSPCSADTEPPGLSLVVSWWLETDMPLQQWRCFFPAILLITLRAFWLDWNFCRRVLYMLSSLLCPSVCLVSLKIDNYRASLERLPRTSCVCAYNASSIVFFSHPGNELSSLPGCDKTNILWKEKGKDISLTCRDNGTFRLSPQQGFCISCRQLTTRVIWHCHLQ